MRSSRTVALLACTLVAATAQAKGKAKAAAHAEPRLVTAAEGITEYALSNGLRVLLFPEPSKPTVTVNITYLVGSRHEGYGETGMAHLLEHMMFKGSKNHANIPQELTAHGARPNGTTSYDRTNYFETFASSDENLKWALDLEADRMVNSYIARKDLDSEMTVVRNEYEMGENNPEHILQQRVMSTAFLWHNYGKSTIGARSDIEQVPIEHLQAFWRKYYQPDNAVLVVAGNFDPAKTLALIDKTFSAIPKPTRELDRTYTREPAQDGERSVTLRRAGDVQVVACLYHVPSTTHPDAAPLDVLGEVLSATPSGRLYKALVETKKAASTSAWYWNLDEPGVLYASASVRQNGSLDEARTILLDTLDNLGKTPITQEEVDRGKASLLKSVQQTLENTERLGLTLSEWIADGDWRLFFLYRDQLKKVTPADVNRVIGTYLKPTNRTLGEFIPTQNPERVTVPEAPPAATLLAGFKGDTAMAMGEAFDPAPAAIEKRVTRSTLSVGMQLALLPKKTRNSTVVAALTLRYGDDKTLANRGQLPSFTTAMFWRGTNNHTREQIRDAFDKLKARVNIFSPYIGQTRVTIETVRENLPAVLSLVAEMLRSSSFPAEEVDNLRQEWLADLEKQKSDPQAIAQTAAERHQHPYDKADGRYTPTVEEEAAEVTAATRDEIEKFFFEVYGATSSQLAVVGDFDPATLTKQVTDLFGDWVSPVEYKRLPFQYFDAPADKLSFETPDKENAIYLWQLNVPMRDDDSDYPGMVLGNYLLGGGFLNSRLATRIREKEGLSYGVGSQFFANGIDKAGGFTGYAIYAPVNADRVSKAFDEEVARVLKDGFEAKEIADAKSGYLQGRQVSRSQDASLASLLSDELFLGRTLAWDEKLEKHVKSLKPAEIRSAMRKFLTPEKLARFKAGDFVGAAKKAAAAVPAPAAAP